MSEKTSKQQIRLYPCKGSLTYNMIHKIPLNKFDNKEYLEKKKKEIAEFRKKRLNEYSLLDERRYYFTLEQFEDFLKNENFDIEVCNINNIRKIEAGERHKREEERIRQDEEYYRSLQIYRQDEINFSGNYFNNSSSYIEDTESYSDILSETSHENYMDTGEWETV